MTPGMTPGETQAIERECARLIYRYAYLNDERDFDTLVTLFSEDAVLYRPSAPDQALKGRDAILTAFRSRSPEIRTFHVCSDLLITADHPDRATARSRILMLSQQRSDNSTKAMPVPGTFEDEFCLTPQGWKFALRRGKLWI